MKKNETKNIEAENKKPAKAEKAKSPAKTTQPTVPASKLPKLLKKEYTEKQLEKKIFKRIYIPEDKKLLENYIKETGKNKKGLALYSIPKDAMLTKKDAARLKILAKEINSQKSRIRWIPLLITVAIIVALIFVISAFKNPIAKKAIKSVCETTFEAKCDIDSLDISFINSYFKLDGLQIANKEEPMKNLVQVEKIAFDFDLTQLLRARFVANELAITGVATNTDRTYSGDISEQLKAKIEKKKAKKAAKEAKKTEDSDFMKSLSEKSDLAMDTLKSSVNGLFDQYNPQKIIDNCYTQLETPGTVKATEEEVKAIVAKWSAEPKKWGDKVNTLSQASKEVINTDVNSLKTDPVKLKTYIESVNLISKEASSLKTDIENLGKDVQKDANTTGKLSKNIEASIKHDTNLVNAEISKITSLSLDDGKRFITGTFDNIAYQLLGKYYPYVNKAMNYLKNAKNSGKDKEKKQKVVSTPTDRAEGRTVYFKADATPKIWIKKAAGSGPNFSFDAMDITNDMDKTGKPVTGNVSLTFKDLTHKAKLSVDTRSETKNPLVVADYNCANLPFDYPTSKFGDAPGVPGIAAVSDLNFIAKLYEDDGFDLTGKGVFTNMNITTIPFEPEFASAIYADTLSNIKDMTLSTTIGYTLSKGVNVNLYSDVDKKFMNALTKELSKQLIVVKEKAEAELLVKLNELSGGALGEINSFNDIQNKLTSYTDTVNKIYNQIEEKKKAAENALSNAVNNAVEDTKNKAKDTAKKSAESAIKGLLKQ